MDGRRPRPWARGPSRSCSARSVPRRWNTRTPGPRAFLDRPAHERLSSSLHATNFTVPIYTRIRDLIQVCCAGSARPLLQRLKPVSPPTASLDRLLRLPRLGRKSAKGNNGQRPWTNVIFEGSVALRPVSGEFVKSRQLSALQYRQRPRVRPSCLQPRRAAATDTPGTVARASPRFGLGPGGSRKALRRSFRQPARTAPS